MTGPRDEPAMQQHLTASSGGVVYAVQNGDQYVYIYRDSPPYRVEPFLAQPPPVPDMLVRRAPSWLLAARLDAAIRGVNPPSGQDQAGLSSYLLDREPEYWQAAHHHRAGPVRTSELAMARAVYTATLTRPLTHHDGVAALTRARIGEATTEPVAHVLVDHATLYPPNRRRHGPGTALPRPSRRGLHRPHHPRPYQDQTTVGSPPSYE